MFSSKFYGKDFYLSHYQVVPEFKGGMDMGLVTVAEIGDIKRDIAYHGNVLNTASRRAELNQRVRAKDDRGPVLPHS